MNEAIIDLFKQYAERKKQEMVQKIAAKMGGTVEGSKIVMPDGSMQREYSGSPFISRTLGDVGIRPK